MKRKKWILAAALTLTAALLALLLYQLDLGAWQSLDLSRIRNQPLATVVFDREDAAAGALSGAVNRVWVSLEDLPSYVPQAFVAAEDSRFYSHHGVDVRRIFGALLHDAATLSLSQGASTITQQLIKLTHLTSEKTLARKAQEAYLALKLEKQMTKDEILEAYLNTVYFGAGAYGVQAASQVYFGKDASQMTLSEASLLAGVIQSPSRYAPHRNLEGALQRRSYVLKAMVSCGFLSENQADEAASSVPEIQAAVSQARGWYLDQVLLEAMSLLHTDAEGVLGGGYRVYTYLDTAAQTAAQEALANAQYPEAAAQGALIAMDPQTGGICALVGGRSYTAALGLNRALSARRQPGSLMKPVSTYALAVEKYGYLPSTTVYDVQRSYADGYTPGNSGGNYAGATTLRTALQKSMNAATVDLAETMGVSQVADMAASLGIPLSQEDRNLSLALWSMTAGVTPREMCAAYCALANGGTLRQTACIRRIEDRYGRVVYVQKNAGTQAISPETACILTDMLKSAASQGTARALSALNVPIAGKTGTAGLKNGDTSDVWIAAYTPEICTVVWMGKDDNSGGGMAASVSASGYAAPACTQFLSSLSLSGDDFPLPASLDRVLADRYALESGLGLMLATDKTPREYTQPEIVRRGAAVPVSQAWEAPLPVTDLAVSGGKNQSPQVTFTALQPFAEYLILRKSGAETRVVATLSGSAGEALSFTDTEADTSQINDYSVLPRHRLLYECGQTLSGPVSRTVRCNPGGLLNGLVGIFTHSETAPAVESAPEPLFP